MPNLDNAIMWLQKSISRHERHMMGKEPTTGKDGDISQRLMMEEMQYALRALKGTKEVPASDWYNKNENMVSKIKM